MKTLIIKARDFRLTNHQEDAILISLGMLTLILAFVLIGYLIGRRSMTSGESMIVDRATYECKKTNELSGKIWF